MKTYRPTKRFFRRALAYVGLYVEILSASCRWVVSAPRGWRAPYKTFVTRALKASGYIPPTQEEINAANAQQDINAKYALLTFHAKQPETIQTCLKINRAALLKLRLKKPNPDQYLFAMDSAPAVPSFCKEPELWVNVNGVKLPDDWAAPSAGLNEDGYLK